MTLTLQPSISNKLPTLVKSALSKMSPEEQMMFQEEFQRKSKSTGFMVFLAIFFPIHFFLLGKAGLGLIYWFTWGGCFIWYFVEWFLTPARVREYNDDVAFKVMTDIKIINQK